MKIKTQRPGPKGVWSRHSPTVVGSRRLLLQREGKPPKQLGEAHRKRTRITCAGDRLSYTWTTGVLER